ncbi:NmrA family NAD(P)-binding protein [Gordonia rhizosphera]|uniref:Putative NAD(P)H--quinone oxidoreductase n=1 Tax=Gordonia rhizosphera NBRC 16068 TaxID=1108045 RepID=K6W5A0_9ACTN|nr:NAD(P)H-binding protein [Gordonia rhizosphera]GAB88871.1 putative NAD(P)H--quinone oxidoreductase [Gordonia rhizosphera NBRC 16068]
MTTYAVTGATGGFGSAAVTALISRGVTPADIVAVVRNAEKAAALRAAGVQVRVADYRHASAFEQALAGVDRLLLVSGNEFGQRLSQHTNVVEAAQKAGVGLIAYTSILRADNSPLALATEHIATEKVLADSGIPVILLRNGWYSENYLRSAPAAIEGGVLYGSARDGAVAPAARADYADAAAAALISGRGGEVFELVGSQHLSYADIAAAFAEVSGKAVRYQDLPESDYAAALTRAGIPAAFAGVLADSDAGVAAGALDSDSSDLVDLLGRPATTFAEVIGAGLAGA